MAILEATTSKMPLSTPVRPYLKDQRDPNQIQEDLQREFCGDSYDHTVLALRGMSPTYLIPEIVPFNPEWLDAASGLMVNVPNDPDFLSSFKFRRRHACLAIGTYETDLSYIFPEGRRAMGSIYHGDAILRFSISRTQIRQELPNGRTAVMRLRNRIVQIMDKHGEAMKTWAPYRAYRSTNEGPRFDTVWHARSKKAYLDRMPETVGELYSGLTALFENLLRLHGLEAYSDEYEWALQLEQAWVDASDAVYWPKRLTGIGSYALWSEAIARFKNVKDLSKLERYSDACREETMHYITRLITEALVFRSCQEVAFDDGV